MSGGGAKHVTEPAEHMRTNGVTFVLTDVDAGLPLSREDIEVIEPEIDQHLLELSLAVNGAQQLRFGELVEDPALCQHRGIDEGGSG